MQIEDVHRYLAQAERAELEFKAAQNALPENIFDTVCAFLNNKGGTIILGVNNNGGITGINEKRIDEIEHDLITQSNNKKKLNPPFILYPEKFVIDNKHIIAVRVPVSSQVHSHRGQVYDRSGDADLKVEDTDQKNEIYNRKRNHFTENEIYPYLTEQHLNMSLLEKARNLIYSNNPEHPWLKLNNKQLLITAGLYATDLKTGKEGFTLAAALLFGTDNVIRQILPQYRIDAMVRIENTARYDDRVVIETNLIDAYEMLMAFVAKHFNDTFFMEGTTRISLRDKIFRELVANLIVHREYTNSYPASFIKYKDHVEFKNANNPKDYRKLSVGSFEPYQKNPNIARFYRAIGRGEEIGSGVMNVSKYLQHYAKDAKFEFIEDSIFLVKLNISTYLKNKTVETKEPDNNNKFSELFHKLIELKLQNKNKNIAEILVSNELLRFQNGTIKPQNGTIKPQNGTIKPQNGTVEIELSKKQRDRLVQVLLIISQNKQVKTQDLIKNINAPERTIKRDIKILKELDLIYYSGSKKSGGYRINNSLLEFIKQQH